MILQDPIGSCRILLNPTGSCIGFLPGFRVNNDTSEYYISLEHLGNVSTLS